MKIFYCGCFMKACDDFKNLYSKNCPGRPESYCVSADNQ